MDAVKFIKERIRMCNYYAEKNGMRCGNCPLHSEPNELYNKNCTLSYYDKEHTNNIVKVVEKWSKENPEKTILQDFLEKYPNAPLTEAGLPDGICPFMLGYKGRNEKCIPDEYFCKQCWNRPLEE